MSTDIDSDDPIYEVDRLSADKPQARTVPVQTAKLAPFIPTVGSTKLAPFIPVQSAKLAPFIPVQSAKLEPFIPTTPATPGAEEPATPALRLAQEIASQYTPPAKSELPRLVAGETARGFQEQETQQPESQKPSGNPVQDFIDNIVNRFQQSTSEISKGSAEAQLQHDTSWQRGLYADTAKEDQIIKDPNAPREAVDDAIARKNQAILAQKQAAQKTVEQETQAQIDLQKKALGEQYQQSIPGKISGAIGGAIPNLVAGLTGPLAPVVVREQIASQTYSQVYDSAKDQATKAHPDWTPEQVEEAAKKSATDASAQSSVGMLGLDALGMIPTVGPLLGRMAQRIGWGALGMELSNIYNQWKTNEAIQRHADPNQDLLQHIRDLDFHIENLVSGGAFSLGGALGEIKGPEPAKPQVPETIKPTGPETGTLTTPSEEKGLGLGQQPGEQPTVLPAVTVEGQTPTPQPVTESQHSPVLEPVRPEVQPPVDQEAADKLLKAQADELYDRNKTEAAIAPLEPEPERNKIIAPTNEPVRPIFQPTEPARPAVPVAPEPVGTVGADVTARETGALPVSERRGADVGTGAEPTVSGREPETRTQAVQPEPGPVPRSVEGKLSGAERKALRPEVQALKDAPRDPTDPTFIQAFRDLREKVIAKFQGILNASGISRTEEGSHYGASIDPLTGERSLQTNTAEGAIHIADVLEHGGDPLEAIHSAIQEELRHSAHQKVVYDDWVRGGRQGTLTEAFANHARTVFNDLRAAREEAERSGNRQLASNIDGALEHSWPLYNIDPHMSDAEAFERALQSSDPTEITKRVMELVRQIGQIKSGDLLTETAWRRVWIRAREWLLKVREHLAGLVSELGPGKALEKTELGRVVRRIDAEIKAMDENAREGIKRAAVEQSLNVPRGTISASAPSMEAVRLRGQGAEEGKKEDRRRYEGAPPGVTNARQLRALKDKLIQLAREGEAFRHWYEGGAHPMMRAVGNIAHRFEQLMANIAATSPQNRVYPNFGMAARGMAQQESGGRRITVGKGALMKQRLAEIGAGNIWKGVKINQFYRDHMAVFDRRLADDMGSTMDMHMARAFGYPSDSFTPVQSQWAQGIMREITREMGWEKPKHTQAAIWSAFKARFEAVWPQFRDQADAAGDRIKKGKKTDFIDAETERKYRTPALEAAMKIPPPDLSDAAFNFGDAMRRDLGTASYETRPSADIQAQHPWMRAMTSEDWDQYHRQASAIVTNEDGTNKLAVAANLLALEEHEGYSAWGEERNLSQQIAIVMPKAAGRVLGLAKETFAKRFKIDPTVEHQVKDFAAATGLLYQQDGVGYHKAYWGDVASGVTKKNANGTDLVLGRTLSAEETTRLVNALDKEFPSYEPLGDDKDRGWYVSPHKDGIEIISWGHPDANVLHNAIRKVIPIAFKDSAGHMDIKRFAAYGDILKNNWKKQPNGDNYRAWLGKRGRSDLLATVEGILRPQIESLNAEWQARKTRESAGERIAAGRRAEIVPTERRVSPELARPPPEAGIVAEAPRPQVKRTLKEAIQEAIAKRLLWHSTRIKGGESSMLDYSETQPIAVALRRWPSFFQRIGEKQKLYELQQAFYKGIPKAERPRVTSEFVNYITKEQNKQPLPTVGADTMRVISAAKDSLGGTGGIMKVLNVHVDDNGVIRPARLIGANYFPWGRIDENTRHIFENRDGSRAADYQRMVNDAIAADDVKNEPEFREKFTNEISGEVHQKGEFFHARERSLPLKHYDMGPESLIRYLLGAQHALADTSVYGQKLRDKGKTIFDRGIEEVKAAVKSEKYTPETAQKIIDRITWERDKAFEQSKADWSSDLRNFSTGVFLGSPSSSFKNFFFGAVNNLLMGGPSTFARAGAHLVTHWQSSFLDANRKQILKNSLRDVLNDYALASNPSWLSKKISQFTNLSLSAFQQNSTENLNRTFAMVQAKTVLQDFLREHLPGKTNAAIRSRDAFMLRRFGVKDPKVLDRLAAEKGNGPMSDEFIRQYVLDTHGSYSQSQFPAHIFDSNTGKVLFQFQKYGANQTRLIAREYVMPLDEAWKNGNASDVGYQFMRNMAALGVAGVGFGTAGQMAINAAYRRDPSDPAWEEIGKALMEGRNQEAVSWMLQRAWGAFIFSGISGLVGNYLDLGSVATGQVPLGRLKDPMHPPSESLIQPLWSLAQGWMGEGGKLPSGSLIRQFLQSFPAVGQPTSIAFAATSRIPALDNGWPKEYAAQQDRNFVRNRIKMFAQQNPALQEKAAAQGTQQMQIQMAGRKPFSPTKDLIINGLLTGNPNQVTAAIRDWLAQVPPKDVKAEMDLIKSVIEANNPFKVGGSTKPELVNQFLSWVKQDLPAGEGRRIFALAKTYQDTAFASGLEGQPPGQLSYDTFRPSQISQVEQKLLQQQAELKGRQAAMEMEMRQRIAKQLLGAH